MAKQGKLPPARRQRDDDSLLIRSAESLGRMIGTLQRQLDDATRRLSPRPFVPDTTTAADGDGHSKRKQGKTAIRKSKRTSKSAATKKSAGRTRSGASRKKKAARRT